jgi:hypothetical protein
MGGDTEKSVRRVLRAAWSVERIRARYERSSISPRERLVRLTFGHHFCILDTSQAVQSQARCTSCREAEQLLGALGVQLQCSSRSPSKLAFAEIEMRAGQRRKSLQC